MPIEPISTGKPLSDERQWQLALAHLNRADQSATVVRILLFAAAVGLFAIELPQVRPASADLFLWGHVAAVLLSLLAIFFFVRSWQVQKEKSISRFNYLKSGNLDAYTQYNTAIEHLKSKRNSRLDWIGFWLMVSSALIEIALRALPSGPVVLGPALNV